MRPRSVSLFRGRIFSLRRSNDNRVCFNKIARGLTRIRGYNLFEQVSITPIQKLWSVLDNRSNSYLLICSFNKFFFFFWKIYSYIIIRIFHILRITIIIIIMEILLNYCDTCFETTFQRNGVKLKCFAPVFEHITRNKRQRRINKFYSWL